MIARATVEMPDRAAWRSWLESNHRASRGVWLQLEKIGSAGRLRYEEAVEEALCFGWIDSQVRGMDATRYLITFTPRRPASNWSKLNRQRVERLQREGLMTAAGIAAVEEGKRTGSWFLLDAVERLEVPDDLDGALSSDASARLNFEAFPASARKEYLYWVLSAKRPETRARRVREVAELASANRASRHDQR